MLALALACLMSNIFELGRGDILRGFVYAIKTGTMEFPFGPSKPNNGTSLMVRDDAGRAAF